MIHRLNAILFKVQLAFDALNGWKQVMINIVLLAIPLLNLFNEWIQTISGVSGLVLLVWMIIKGYYQVENWREDLKMKRLNREMKQQEYNQRFVSKRSDKNLNP